MAKPGVAMKPDWATEDGSVAMYLADSRELLPMLAAGSIDMLLTDPPFGHNNNNGDLTIGYGR